MDGNLNFNAANGSTNTPNTPVDPQLQPAAPAAPLATASVGTPPLAGQTVKESAEDNNPFFRPPKLVGSTMQEAPAAVFSPPTIPSGLTTAANVTTTAPSLQSAIGSAQPAAGLNPQLSPTISTEPQSPVTNNPPPFNPLRDKIPTDFWGLPGRKVDTTSNSVAGSVPGTTPGVISSSIQLTTPDANLATPASTMPVSAPPVMASPAPPAAINNPFSSLNQNPVAATQQPSPVLNNASVFKTNITVAPDLTPHPTDAISRDFNAPGLPPLPDSSKAPGLTTNPVLNIRGNAPLLPPLPQMPGAMPSVTSPTVQLAEVPVLGTTAQTQPTVKPAETPNAAPLLPSEPKPAVTTTVTVAPATIATATPNNLENKPVAPASPVTKQEPEKAVPQADSAEKEHGMRNVVMILVVIILGILALVLGVILAQQIAR